MPAAIGNVLTADNAPKLRTKLVVEAANHPRHRRPTTSWLNGDPGHAGHSGQRRRGNRLLLQWTQNLQEFRWEESRVNEELLKIMDRGYQAVREMAASQVSLTVRRRFESARNGWRAVELRGFV